MFIQIPHSHFLQNFNIITLCCVSYRQIFT